MRTLCPQFYLPLNVRVFNVLRTLQYQGKGNTSYTYQSGGFVTRWVKIQLGFPLELFRLYLRAKVSP